MSAAQDARAASSVALKVSGSVQEAVDYVLQGGDQPDASCPATFAALIAHAGVKRLVSLTSEQRAAYGDFTAERGDADPVLKMSGVRRRGPGYSSRLLHPCHVSMVRYLQPS